MLSDTSFINKLLFISIWSNEINFIWYLNELLRVRLEVSCMVFQKYVSWRALSCGFPLWSPWPWHFEPYFNSVHVILNGAHLYWVFISSQDFEIVACILDPQPLPSLAACCLLSAHITPFSPRLPFRLLWWRYCTLLSCMLSRPQCNLVCVIFSHECMHTGLALACWDYSFPMLKGRTGAELHVRMHAL